MKLSSSESSQTGEPKALEFWHCPIPDTGITDYEKLSEAVTVLIQKLQEDRTVYVHCWGGHGRTGTLICAFLVKAYGLTVGEAQQYFMAAHAAREIRHGGGNPYWPHNDAQYKQVEQMMLEAQELRAETQLSPLEDWQLHVEELVLQSPPIPGVLPITVSCGRESECASIVSGTYSCCSENHDRPAYLRAKPAGWQNVLLYYWDGRDGPEFSGWWFGPGIGSDLVWSHNPKDEPLPPSYGWKIPWNSKVDWTVRVATDLADDLVDAQATC